MNNSNQVPAPQPKKWTDAYPYGTKEGDEEAKVFRALARHPKFKYRSIAQIVSTTGLTRQRVEEIIDKYTTRVKPALIYAHPTNDDHWGYWERCGDEVLQKDIRGISTKDKDGRIDNHLTGGLPTVVIADLPAIPQGSVITSAVGNNFFIFNDTKYNIGCDLGLDCHEFGGC